MLFDDTVSFVAVSEVELAPPCELVGTVLLGLLGVVGLITSPGVEGFSPVPVFLTENSSVKSVISKLNTAL